MKVISVIEHLPTTKRVVGEGLLWSGISRLLSDLRETGSLFQMGDYSFKSISKKGGFHFMSMTLSFFIL